MWNFNICPIGHKKVGLKWVFSFFRAHFLLLQRAQKNEWFRMEANLWPHFFSHWTVQSSHPRNPFGALGTGSRAQSGHTDIHTQAHTHTRTHTCSFSSHPSAGLTLTGRVSQNSRLSEGERGQETRVVEESGSCRERNSLVTHFRCFNLAVVLFFWFF